MIPAALLFLFCIAILNTWAWLIVLVATVFSYRYNAVWLFVAGVLCDGYFGSFAQLPVYSLSLGGFALVVEVLKLRLIGVQS